MMDFCRLDVSPPPDSKDPIYLTEEQMAHMIPHGCLNDFDVQFAIAALSKNASELSSYEWSMIRAAFPSYAYWTHGTALDTLPASHALAVREQEPQEDGNEHDISEHGSPQSCQHTGGSLDLDNGTVRLDFRQALARYRTLQQKIDDGSALDPTTLTQALQLYQTLVARIKEGEVDCKGIPIPRGTRHYHCPSCQTTFGAAKKSNWTRHVCDVLLGIPYLTICCGKAKRDSHNLGLHYKIVANRLGKFGIRASDFQCIRAGCDKVLFVQRANLPPICWAGHENPPSVKPSCTPPETPRHASGITKSKSNTKSHVCKKCGRTFASADDWSRHNSSCTGTSRS